MAQIELYQQWLEVVQWFFFSMLILGYVEDPTTGVSFLFPSGLEWRIYIEVSWTWWSIDSRITTISKMMLSPY